MRGTHLRKMAIHQAGAPVPAGLPQLLCWVAPLLGRRFSVRTKNPSSILDASHSCPQPFWVDILCLSLHTRVSSVCKRIPKNRGASEKHGNNNFLRFCSIYPADRKHVSLVRQTQLWADETFPFLVTAAHTLLINRS